MNPPTEQEPKVPGQFMGKPMRWWQRAGGTVLLISILIHVLIVILAGYFVVQHFYGKPKPVPPPESLAQRSESVKVHMDVRQKTMSAPAVVKKVQTESPLAKVSLPEMPDVPTENVIPSTMPGSANTMGTAPGAGGNGGGNGGGVANTTFFGTPGGKDGLIGTFYDLKQTPSRQKLDMPMDKYAQTITKFVSDGWADSVLSKFFKVHDAVASTMIFIPDISADVGPTVFNVAKWVEPKMWIVHYKATVVAPVSGTYHFVGAGDDVLLVGFNKKLVLDRCWNMKILPDGAETNYEYGYTGIPGGFARGLPVDVVAGKSYPIDIVLGEEPGGKMMTFVLLEKEGETYQKTDGGFPILPVFRVANVALPPVAPDLQVPPYDKSIPPWSVWKTVPVTTGGIDMDSFFHQH